jgi:MoxR-like ATPase
VIESVAQELDLGDVLRWHITSKSALNDGLYSYDALGRIHDQQLKASARKEAAGKPGTEKTETADDIAPFLRLGPLGTALVPSDRPRALLIDEIDKSDLDLPSDLLNVLERGEYEIPELVRYKKERAQVEVRTWDDEGTYLVRRGKVACEEFPFIVMTSNEERDFPPAFLRRCIRFTMPPPSEQELRDIVHSLLGLDVPESGATADLVKDFATRLNGRRQTLAVDQLLNAVFVLSGEPLPEEPQRTELAGILLRELSGA